MSDNSFNPTYKKQFVLTIISKRELDQHISREINNAISGHLNLKKHKIYEHISETYRYTYQFGPIDLEQSKRNIQKLQHKHAEDLIIFRDESPTFGLKKISEQIAVAVDRIIGIILPTSATIFYQVDPNHMSDLVQHSLTQIFFDGNDITKHVKPVSLASNWYKIEFKVKEPVSFKHKYGVFKKENKGIVTFDDVTRKEKKDYIPYVGFVGFLFNIVYFREQVLIYADELVNICASGFSGLLDIIK